MRLSQKMLKAISAADWGSRAANNSKMLRGMSGKSLRHHYALWPLYGCMFSLAALMLSYGTRLSVFGADVNFRKVEQPAEELKNKQYKFFNPLGTATTVQDPELVDALKYTDKKN